MKLITTSKMLNTLHKWIATKHKLVFYTLIYCEIDG